MNRIFLDSGYAIALANPSDQYHARATQLTDTLPLPGVPVVTTRPVLLEIGNALSKQKYRTAAIQLLSSIEDDASIDVVELSEALYRAGFELFRQRSDKNWSLTDCISFVVMRNEAIGVALTPDHNFEQAGFRALLLARLGIACQRAS